MTPRTSLCVMVACALATVLSPLPAAGQRPPAATERPTAAANPPQGEKPVAAGATDKTPASLEDLAKRISSVLAEQSGRPPTAGAAPSPGAAGTPIGPMPVEPKRSKPLASRPAPAPKAASLVTLKWDPTITSGGVALSWEGQLDPRRTRRADQGVRLVWPDRLP
jgi:hypothetical protein